MAATKAIIIDTIPHGPLPGRRIKIMMLHLMVEGYGKLNKLEACTLVHHNSGVKPTAISVICSTQ